MPSFACSALIQRAGGKQVTDGNRNQGRRSRQGRVECVEHVRGLISEAHAKKARRILGDVIRLGIARHDPKLSTLTKLARAMKVKMSELLE